MLNMDIQILFDYEEFTAHECGNYIHLVDEFGVVLLRIENEIFLSLKASSRIEVTE